MLCGPSHEMVRVKLKRKKGGCGVQAMQEITGNYNCSISLTYSGSISLLKNWMDQDFMVLIWCGQAGIYLCLGVLEFFPALQYNVMSSSVSLKHPPFHDAPMSHP